CDLWIGEVGDHVPRQPAPRQIAAHHRRQRDGDDRPVVAGVPGDQAGDHKTLHKALSGAEPPAAARRSASTKKVARPTTRSFTLSPERTTTHPCLRNVSPISIRRFSKLNPEPVQARTEGPSGDSR